MEPNPFDEFDNSDDNLVTVPLASTEVNPFDEFDEEPVETQKYEGGVPVGGDSSVRPDLYTGEAAPELPDASAAMYDRDQNFEEASTRYDHYANHPRAQVSPVTGQVSVDGQIVPKPFPNYAGQIGNAVGEAVGAGRNFSDYTANPGDVAVGTVQSGISNITETALTLSDAVTGRNDAAGVKDTLPTLDGGNIANDLVIEGAQLLGGGGVALKGTQALVKVSAASGRLAKAGNLLLRNTAMSVGGTATTKSETDGLVIGTLTEGIDFTGNDTESEKILNKRINLVMEGIIAGSALDLGVDAAGTILNALNENVLQPAKAQMSGDARVQRVLDTLVKKSIGIENAPPEQYRQALLEIADLASQNKEVILQSAKGPTTVKLDSLGAIAEGMETLGRTEDAAVLRGQRANLTQRGVEGMDRQQVRFGNSIEDFKTGMSEGAGGDAGVETARKGLTDTGRKVVDDSFLQADRAAAETGRASLVVDDATEGLKAADEAVRLREADVGVAKEEVRGAKAQVRTAAESRRLAQEEVERLRTEDIQFKDRVALARKDVGIDAKAASGDNAKEVSEVLRKARLADKAEQKAAYDGLSDDLDIDNEALDAAYDKVREVLPKEARAKFEDADFETTRSTKFDLDYKGLRESLPMINDEIKIKTAFLKDGAGGDSIAYARTKNEINDLRNFKSHIEDDQLDAAAKLSMGPDVESQVKRIKDANTKLYTRWDNDGMRDLGYLIDDSVDEAGLVRDRVAVDYDAGTRKFVESTLKDDNKEYAGVVYKTLEEQGEKGKATQFIKGRISAGILSGETSVDEALAASKPYLATLKENDPAAYKELLDFQTEIENYNRLLKESEGKVRAARGTARDAKGPLQTAKDAKTDADLRVETARLGVADAQTGVANQKLVVSEANTALEKSREVLRRFQQEAAETETRVLDSRLKEFFEGTGKNRMEYSDGNLAFGKVFAKGNGEDTITDLLKLADESDTPALIKRGMRAAFGNAFKTAPKDVLTNMNNVKKQADVLFADRPEELASIKKAMDLIVKNDTSSGNASLAAIPKELDEKGRDAVSRLVTTAFGVLNSMATKVRLLSKSAQDTVNPQEHMTKVLGELVSNPEYFAAAARKRAGEVGDQMGGIDKTTLFNLFVRAGVYTDKDRPTYDQAVNDLGKKPVQKQTESLFGKSRAGGVQSRTVTDQTKEALK